MNEDLKVRSGLSEVLYRFKLKPLKYFLIIALILTGVSLLSFLFVDQYKIRNLKTKLSILIKAGNCYNLDGNTCSLRRDCGWIEVGAGPFPSYPQDGYCSKTEKDKLTGSQYCSMENNCPEDKCIKYYPCLDFSYDPTHGTQCNKHSDFPDRCDYKDQLLKEHYVEISFEEATKCLNDFSRDSTEYPLLNLLEINKDSNLYDEKPRKCGSEGMGIEERTADLYCYRIPLVYKALPEEQFPFKKTEVSIGAQTCSVIIEDTEKDIYKIANPNLPYAEIKVNPQEALACAEKYIAENKNKFVEYGLYVPGSLQMVIRKPFKSTYADLDYSRDWMAYDLSAEVPGRGYILFSVGSYSCSVYPAYESRLTKMVN